MKIKIDADGYLEIERGGKMIMQQCPFDNSTPFGTEPVHCGGWCPLFGEPEEWTFDSNMIELKLCKTALSAKPEDFEDER